MEREAQKQRIHELQAKGWGWPEWAEEANCLLSERDALLKQIAMGL
jgi:hypothetical protein